MLKPFAILATTLLTIGGAAASTDDAWAQFAADVEEACLAASAEYFPDGKAVVDPFGSESYGLAIVSGETASLVCVYDKQSKDVEIGGELPVTVTATEAE